MADEGDYWEEHYWDDYYVGHLGGALSGAGTGASIGFAAGGPVGAVYGAMAGGTAGSLMGLYGAHQSVQAQKAAVERDEEIEKQLEEIDKEIRDVDSMGQFISATGAGAAEQAQRAKVQASQDAARMNLSQGAQAEYMRQKERDVQGAYGRMLAGAVAPAKAADIAEKRRLQDEKDFVIQGSMGRQALMDQGERGSDMLASLGQIGALAASAGAFSGGGTTTAAAAGKSIDSTNIDPTSKYGTSGTNKGIEYPEMGGIKAGKTDTPAAGMSDADKMTSKYGAPAAEQTGVPTIEGGTVQNLPAEEGGDPWNYRRTMDESGNWSYETRRGDGGSWASLPDAAKGQVSGEFKAEFGETKRIKAATDAIGDVPAPEPTREKRRVLSSPQEKPDHEVFDFDFGIDSNLLLDSEAPVYQVSDIPTGDEDLATDEEYNESILDALGTLFGGRRQRRRGGNR